MPTEKKKDEIEIKPFNATELAKIYGRTPRTMHTWLKKIKHKIGKPKGQTYSVDQVLQIISILDTPDPQ